MITEGISMKWNIKYGRVCRSKRVSKRVRECAKEKESVSDYVSGREGESECER